MHQGRPSTARSKSTGEIIDIHILKDIYAHQDFPGGSDGKASAYNAGDPGSVPGLGRSPGEGNGTPLQYSCLKKTHGWRSLAGYSSWGRKESDMTERLHFHFHILKSDPVWRSRYRKADNWHKKYRGITPSTPGPALRTASRSQTGRDHSSLGGVEPGESCGAE